MLPFFVALPKNLKLPARSTSSIRDHLVTIRFSLLFFRVVVVVFILIIVFHNRLILIEPSLIRNAK